MTERANQQFKFGATVIAAEVDDNGMLRATIGWPKHVPLKIGQTILFDLYPPGAVPHAENGVDDRTPHGQSWNK